MKNRTRSIEHKFLTRHDIADRWQTSLETVKRREIQGVLKPLKFGRGVRYRLSDIEAYEKSAEVGARR